MTNKKTSRLFYVSMLLSVVILVFILMQLSACYTDYDQWKDDIKKYSNDNQIDEKEFKLLLDFVKSCDDDEFKQLKHNKGDILESETRERIKKYTKASIWEPQKVVKSFDINFYLENSGSMNGYLDDPNTQFKNSVYSLLARLKLFVNKNKLNLYLINTADQLIHRDANNNDIEHFKDILNPSDFKRISSGRTGQSDLNEMIKRCIQNSKNAMSVFVSDCIYSPGKSHPDATQFLADEKNGLFLNVSTELGKRDLAIIVLQVDANFKGDYYNKLNDKKIIGRSIKRPFYIWFIGNNDQIKSLIDSKKLAEIDGGYKNIAVFEKPNNTNVPSFRLVSNPRIGEFDIDPNGTIINNAESQRRTFSFCINVDFSNNIQGLDYFTSIDNYNISNKDYKYKIVKLGEDKKPFTHQIQFTTTNLKTEILSLEVKGKLPSWVDSSSSNDDTNFTADINQWSKTFGLSYLLGGVADAFYPKSSNNTIKSININIIKK